MNRVSMPMAMILVMCLGTFAVALGHQFIQMKTITFFVLLILGSVIITLPNKWSLRILFTYVAFEGFAKVISNYHPVIHVGVDLLVMVLIAKTMILLVLGKIRNDEPAPPLTALFAVHFIWYFLSFANPYSLGIFPSLAAAKVYVTMFMLFFFAYYMVKKDPNEAKIIMLIWIGTTSLHSFVSIYQAANGPQSVLNIHPRYASILAKYAGGAFRPFGLTHLPGLPAIFIFLAMPFLLFFFFTTRNIFVKILCFSQIPLWLITSFLCQVRSALLKTIVGAAFFLIAMFFIKSRKSFSGRKATNIFLGLAASSVLIFTMPSLIQESESFFPDAAQAFERSFSLFDFDSVAKARKGAFGRFLVYLDMVPFGAGLSRTGPAAGVFKHLIESPDDPLGNIFFTDNFWLATLVDLGAPGSLILTLLVALIFLRSILSLRKIYYENERMIHLAMFSGILASGIGMYGAEAFLYNPEACFFWYFSGSLIALQERSKIHHKEALDALAKQPHSKEVPWRMHG